MTQEAQLVFGRPEALADVVTHYCPGCIHGIVHRLVAEIIDELDIRERTVGVAPVGCSVLAYNYFETDFSEAAHGRAPAMATGMKRTNPDLVIFTYQGDGDLVSIGHHGIHQQRGLWHDRGANGPHNPARHGHYFIAIRSRREKTGVPSARLRTGIPIGWHCLYRTAERPQTWRGAQTAQGAQDRLSGATGGVGVLTG